MLTPLIIPIDAFKTTAFYAIARLSIFDLENPSCRTHNHSIKSSIQSNDILSSALSRSPTRLIIWLSANFPLGRRLRGIYASSK
jgi:hypothetical protein